MKAGVIALAVTFGIGLIAGIQTSGQPEVEYKVIHDTKTVTETETVTVPGNPPSECADMVKYAKVAFKSASAFDLTNAATLDIMSQSRVAIMDSDASSLNLLDTQLRRLESKTINAIEEIGEATDPFNESVKACMEGLK